MEHMVAKLTQKSLTKCGLNGPMDSWTNEIRMENFRKCYIFVGPCIRPFMTLGGLKVS